MKRHNSMGKTEMWYVIGNDGGKAHLAAMVLIEGKHSPSLLQCRTRTCSTSRALGFSSEENARCIYSNFAIFQSSQSCLTVTGAFLLQYTSPPAAGKSVRWPVSQTGRGMQPQSAHLPQRVPYSTRLYHERVNR